ncbi:MAG: hypothetical protein IKS99_04510 [Firmicutes bacterium]|nr:hypothetical protein [Bacillota bacterium]
MIKRIILLLTAVLMVFASVGCGPKEVVKSKEIFLIDLPAMEYKYVPLKNYQSTYPNSCSFASKGSEDEVMDAIRSELGDKVQVTEFLSSYGIKAYLLEITGEDHTYFQNFYVTSQSFASLSDDYNRYELNCGEIEFYSGNDHEHFYGDIIFPSVILDSDYTYEYINGEKTIYQCYDDTLYENKKYQLRESVSGYVDHIKLLNDYYSKHYLYDSEILNDHQLRVITNKSVLEKYIKTGEDEVLQYDPTNWYYMNDFIISIENNYLYITIPEE